MVKDGDLVAIVQHMLTAGGPDTVRVTKVKGHATEVDVEQGRVRADDKVGNDEADVAARLGRRRQAEGLIDARRDLFTARDLWYPIVGQLHRFGGGGGADHVYDVCVCPYTPMDATN